MEGGLTRQEIDAMIKEAIMKDRETRATLPEVQHVKKAKIEKPEKFTGDQSTTRRFVAEVENYLEYHNELFADDRSKIQFVCSLLSATVSDWRTNLTTRQHECLSNFESFWMFFQNEWHAKNDRLSAKQQLLSLTQGKHETVNEFSVRLDGLSILAGQTEEDKVLAFVGGLHPNIYEKLIGRETSEQTYQTVLRWASRLEGELALLEFKKLSKTRDTNTTSDNFNAIGSKRMRMKTEERPRKRNGVPREEWTKRMKAGVCCKCTKSGHRAADCPESEFVLAPYVVKEEEEKPKTTVMVNKASVPNYTSGDLQSAPLLIVSVCVRIGTLVLVHLVRPIVLIRCLFSCRIKNDDDICIN
jgi:hypothetical protein